MDKLKVVCPRCAEMSAGNARFCSQCGNLLPKDDDAAGPTRERITPQPPASDAALEGERRLITALIVDMKNSVLLLGSLDPEQSHRIVEDMLGMLVASVTKFGGHVLSFTGDGIYAAFGTPRAYQDHAQRAVHAALDMLRSMSAHARGRSAGDPLVEISIGIESGEVVASQHDVGHGEVTVTVGQTVNLASRVQGVAPPGSVLIGEQARTLVDGYFELRALPAVQVKGVAQPVTLHEVVGAGRLRRHSQLSERRGLSPFVGREAEQVRMQATLDAALGGRGQVFCVVAEAGGGKSRLCQEFIRILPNSIRLVEAHAVAYARTTPWFPVISMLLQFFAVSEHDNAEERRGKIGAALSHLTENADQIGALLFALLGITDGPDPFQQMDPRVRRDRTIEAIIKLILAQSEEAPVVLLFEDLHWIDDLTKLLIERLATAIIRSRVLLLATYRPEYTPSWQNRRTFSTLALGSLDSASSETLLTSLVGDDTHLSDVKQQIFERTSGNPFFMEEIVNSLADGRMLTRARSAGDAKAVAPLKIPITVRAVLQERIDQLPQRHKELLQILSVIGQAIPSALACDMMPWQAAETMALLDELQQADFVYAIGEHALVNSRSDYAFKHDLTLEVAYQTMLSKRRQVLHQKVADAIARAHADLFDDPITMLVHHYCSADDHPKAAEYLGKAGEQAIQRATHHDAARFFREALRRVGLMPRDAVRPADEARLWCNLGISLLPINGYADEEVGLAYQRARDISIAAADDLSLALAQRGSFLVNISRANYQGALQAGRELLEIGSRNPQYLLEGYVCLAITSIYIGELEDSEGYFIQALDMMAEQHSHEGFHSTGHTEAFCRAYYAVCTTYRGRIDHVLAESDRAMVMSDALSIPITTAQTLTARGAALHLLRLYREAESCYDRALSCAETHGLVYWTAFCTMARAAIAADRGDPIGALETFDRGRLEYQQSGAQMIMSWFLCLRAEMLSKAGRIGIALADLADTASHITATGETIFEAEIIRLRGALLWQKGEFGGADEARQAEGCFHRSLSVARQQKASLYELRAGISLASLWTHQGRYDAALELLRPIYVQFVAAVEIPDLAEARGLLDFLGTDGRGEFPRSVAPGTALLEKVSASH